MVSFGGPLSLKMLEPNKCIIKNTYTTVIINYIVTVKVSTLMYFLKLKARLMTSQNLNIQYSSPMYTISYEQTLVLPTHVYIHVPGCRSEGPCGKSKVRFTVPMTIQTLQIIANHSFTIKMIEYCWCNLPVLPKNPRTVKNIVDFGGVGGIP